ncbi:MAG: radical SAM protein [Deltaproteobacteria bacterium]|nr:radical SAM protein [Deltaproteobacteria bacterium]
MKKKALLINPPTGKYIRDDRCQAPVKGLSSSLRMPLDLAYLAAILEQEGYECKLQDYPAYGKSDWNHFQNDLLSFQPHMLIISVTTPTLLLDLKSCEEAKKINPKILTIAKGAHFITEDRSVMERFHDLDVAIRGEAELTIKELGQNKPLDQILGLTYRAHDIIHRTADRPFLDDMDSLPYPARHLLDNSLYRRPDTDEPMTSIATNKGCPAKCIFCLVPAVSGHKIQSRSAQSIADEMQHCYEKYGISNFYFRADTFTWFKEWTLEVCRAISSKNLKLHWVCNSRVNRVDEEMLIEMKKAGCWLIGFGIESGDAELLKKMKKGATLDQAENAVNLCHKVGIKAYLFFTFGLPWEDEASVNRTIAFSRKLKGDFCEFQIMYPFPATELYDIAGQHGLFEKADLFKGDYKQGIIRTFTLSQERLQHYQYVATKKYYLQPQRILRLLRGISSPRVFSNYVRKGLAIFQQQE